MSGKYALIIGNTEHTDVGLANIITPQRDVEEFARVLKDPGICAFDQVNVLINQLSFRVFEAIEEFFDQKKPNDLLVLYYSGLGIKDEYGSVYLACTNTMRSRLRSTAIKSDLIQKTMEHSRSKRQVVILDSCNSGMFPEGSKAEVGGTMGLTTALQGFGRFVFTAGDLTQFIWQGNQLIGSTRTSLLTHFLVKGLEGDADYDADGNITVDELYDYACEQISRITPEQTPTKTSMKQVGEIILRQIARPQDMQSLALPEDLLAEIEDVRPYVREAAVEKLARILTGNSITVMPSAIEALEKIAADENSTRRVSLAATRVLEAYRRRNEELENKPKIEDGVEQPLQTKTPVGAFPPGTRVVEHQADVDEPPVPEQEMLPDEMVPIQIGTTGLAEEGPSAGQMIEAKTKIVEDEHFEKAVERQDDYLLTGDVEEAHNEGIKKQKQPKVKLGTYPHKKPKQSAQRKTRQESEKETTEVTDLDIESRNEVASGTEIRPLITDKEESIWVFGKQQLFFSFLGAILYATVGLFSPSIGSVTELKISILVFCSLAFGPWVGLITGVVGHLIYLIFVS